MFHNPRSTYRLSLFVTIVIFLASCAGPTAQPVAAQTTPPLYTLHIPDSGAPGQSVKLEDTCPVVAATVSPLGVIHLTYAGGSIPELGPTTIGNGSSVALTTCADYGVNFRTWHFLSDEGGLNIEISRSDPF